MDTTVTADQQWTPPATDIYGYGFGFDWIQGTGPEEQGRIFKEEETTTLR